MQKINVTLTDEIPPELLAKMESMGIDTKRLHLKGGEENPQKKASSMVAGASKPTTAVKSTAQTTKSQSQALPSSTQSNASQVKKPTEVKSRLKAAAALAAQQNKSTAQ